MDIQNTSHEHLLSALKPLAKEQHIAQHTNDAFGNSFYWFQLDMPDNLLEAARSLHDAGARLAMISAYTKQQEAKRNKEVAYHFELGGVTYTLLVLLSDAFPDMPSITPLFRNADWHEREMMELYGVPVRNHPNPRRLFLDETLDAGLLGSIVPLSVMMNGACTKDLWERVMESKGTKENS